jgi:hypothetical protein
MFTSTSALNPCAPVFTPGKPFEFAPIKASTSQAEAVADKSRLPAVVSVKKSSRGCAVILLRDPIVHQRALWQKVAVIDGVCVEVKNHVSKRAGREEEVGVFVAWGQRVERRVTVSEESLEDHFNGLAADDAAFTPHGLEVKPPFLEGLVSFPLVSSLAVAEKANAKAVALTAKPQVDTPEQAKLLDSVYCPRESIENLWEAKGRLDDLWKQPPPPLARSLMTRIARAELFPHSGEGGKDHANRAGDKLSELAAFVGLLDGVPKGSAFLDLCGGPGAWSQFVFDQRPELNLRGFGLTLRSGTGDSDDWHAASKDDWYPELTTRRDWRALWGCDRTGDLLKPENLEHCAKELARANAKVFMCLADGGFSDESIPPNLLELYFYRLLLAELLLAVSCLQPDGRFVCKLYSTLSSATSSLLFLATRLFKDVRIVKPRSSRVTGPERYLVAFGYRGKHTEEVAIIMRAMKRSHEFVSGASPLLTPLLRPVVPTDELARDSVFTEAARTMATRLCERQQIALNAVVDRAIFLERMALDVADALEMNQSSTPVREEQENQPPIEQGIKSYQHAKVDEEKKQAPALRCYRRGGA